MDERNELLKKLETAYPEFCFLVGQKDHNFDGCVTHADLEAMSKALTRFTQQINPVLMCVVVNKEDESDRVRKQLHAEIDRLIEGVKSKPADTPTEVRS